MAAYDRVLEAFSRPISRFINYNLDSQQQLIVLNETADLYRFFDATAQAEYLFDCIEDTISRDLKRELDFLKFFDAAMKDVMDIVDMPNQRAALLIKLVHQNKGKLSKAKRDSFARLAIRKSPRLRLPFAERHNNFRQRNSIFRRDDFRSRSSFIFLRLHDIHGESWDSTDVGRIGWITHLLRAAIGLLRSNENQLSIVHFAPSAT
jgi:hypothetical protein